MIQSLIYTLTAVILYFISDWLLQRMEIAAGRRFRYRSVIFFFILAFLALSSFSLLRYYFVNQ